jgi:hypothetical protein
MVSNVNFDIKIRAPTWKGGKVFNILFFDQARKLGVQPSKCGIEPHLSTTAGHACLTIIGFGKPVDPDVCRTTNGSDIASSHGLSKGYFRGSSPTNISLKLGA